METLYVNHKTQRVSDMMPEDMTDVDEYYFECDHQSVTMRYKLYAIETRFEPAEYLSRATCNICGEDMDGEDVPEYAERVEP